MKRLAMMLLAATAILVSACGIDRSESMGTVPIDPPPATSPSTVDPEGSATTTAPPGPTGRSPAVQPARATTVSLALHEPAAAEVSAVRAPPAVAGQAAAVSVRPFLSDVTLAPEGGSVLREVVLSGSEHANDVQVRVTFDLSGLAGVATMAEPSGCATSGQTVTCDTRVSFGMWATAATWVRLSPAPDAREGGHGTIVVTASAAGGSGSHTATVRIGAAVDLIAGPSQSVTIRAGVSRAAPLPVRVGGSRTAHGSVVQFDGDASYLARQNFANCHYFLGQITYCDIDTALAPGRTYDFSPQLTLRTDPAEPAGQKRMWATWHTRDQWEQVSSTLRHKGVQFGWPGTGAPTGSRTAARDTDIRQ